MIAPQAIVDPAARLADGVGVGPYSVIGPEVEVGAGSWIGSHVVVKGPTRIGRENRIFHFSSIGEIPQDKKYAGEETRLEIGDRNTIREFCTLNRGTVQDAGVTRIGDDNWIMAYVHVAHDCLIGDRNTLANAASLAGHTRVDHDVILGGFTLVHQFCRIGAHSFCSMGSGVKQDVPPFVTVAGNPAEPYGINAEGLRRQGYTAEEIQAVRRAYKAVYKSQLRLDVAIQRIAELAESAPCLAEMSDFLASSRRGIVR